MNAVDTPTVVTAASSPTASRDGLTADEVAARVAAGRTNAVDLATSRSLGAIVHANVFTRFNALLGALLVVILLVGPLQDALFGFVLVGNAAIGIVQELRAKRTLDRLAVVTTPRVSVVRDGTRVEIAPADVVIDDIVELTAGDQVVVDATVLTTSGLAVDESLLTGESEPVRKDKADRVLSGSFVTAGWGRIRATAVGNESYGARLAEEARKFTLVRSDLRRGTDQLLRGITWVMVPVGTLLVWSQLRQSMSLADAARGSVAGTVTMVPEGLVLLTSLAFAIGVLRLAGHRVLTQELPAIEGLARVDTLCIDKTGTLTSGRLRVQTVERLAGAPSPAAALAAIAANDQSPNATMVALQASTGEGPGWALVAHEPFSSARKWAGFDFGPHGKWLLGAPDVLSSDRSVLARVRALAAAGDRILLLARGSRNQDQWDPTGCRPVALLTFADELRGDAAQTLDYLQSEGLRVIVMSGDHPDTVGAVAARLALPGAEHPLDARTIPDTSEALAEALERSSIFGRVSPQQKRAVVRVLQQQGHVVAMTGDGVNDALALKEADIGVAMGGGAPATRAVAQLVLLDSDFAAVPAVVAEGRRVIANVERVANLFLTKTAYATILALAVGIAGLPFPFLPRHLTLVSSLTIGIPGFFLALAPNTRRSRPGFVRRTLGFAIPAGTVAAGATFLMYLIARHEPDVGLGAARTLTTIVLFSIALWVLAILARTAATGRQWLVIVMGAGFVTTLVIPAMRDFFALTIPRPLLWLAAVGVAALAGLALELGWRVATSLMKGVHHS